MVLGQINKTLAEFPHSLSLWDTNPELGFNSILLTDQHASRKRSLVVIWRTLHKWRKHGNNLHCLIHVILDFSLSFEFSLFPPLCLSLSVSLSLFLLPSFFLAGIQFHTWGSRMRGRSGLCQQRPAFYFFRFIFFLLIQGEWREKEKLNCPLSSLLRTYTSPLFSHTIADTDSFPRVFSLQLSCLAEQQELLEKMTFHL